MHEPSVPSMLLLGPDFVDPGAVELRSIGDGSAAAFSVGQEAAIKRKTKGAAPNEDALYLLDDGERAVQIVADGHYGIDASVSLVTSLAEIFDRGGAGTDPVEAWGEMARAWRRREDLGKSRSTIVLAALDRAAGRVRGLTIGDSACFLASTDGVVVRLDTPSRHYAAPWDLYSLGLPPSSHFEMAVAPGAVLLSCTDGVHECRYGQPDVSVQTEDLGELVELANGRVSAIAENLAHLALAGVRDSSGGEDNVAIAASRC